MFSDLHKAEGGRDEELLSWKVVSSNMHWKIIIYIEIREEKLSKRLIYGIIPPTVIDLSESSRDALSVFPWTLTKSKMSVTS